jgi:magnesium transporter
MKLSQISPTKFFQRSIKKSDHAEGVLIAHPHEETTQTKVELISYNTEKYFQEYVEDLEKLDTSIKDKYCNWINVTGLRDVQKINKIGQEFELNHLLIQDVLHTRQRPKYELNDETIFIVVKMFILDSRKEIHAEQVSFVFKNELVATFQETEGDVFGFIRGNIKDGGKRIRSMGCDYLIYELLDAIVDNYFTVLEELGNRIEIIEEELLSNPTSETLHKLNKIKQDSMLLRRSLWPLRVVVNRFEREETSLVKNTTRPYIRDIYDHTIQAIEAIESYRDVLSGMVDIYLSSISNRMNAIMKVLTVISTIFIPLTFLVGVYGMNFRNLPELNWHYGYHGVWVVIIITAVSMIAYFKRKKWF